jgi:biofilm PGA synthesis protein PgaD
LFAMACWHVARERITRGAFDLEPKQTPLDQHTLATHFQLSSHQLNDVQHSRVTVIYHSGEGMIDRLETDRLHLQPAGVTPLFGRLRVA